MIFGHLEGVVVVRWRAAGCAPRRRRRLAPLGARSRRRCDHNSYVRLASHCWDISTTPHLHHWQRLLCGLVAKEQKKSSRVLKLLIQITRAAVSESRFTQTDLVATSSVWKRGGIKWFSQFFWCHNQPTSGSHPLSNLSKRKSTVSRFLASQFPTYMGDRSTQYLCWYQVPAQPTLEHIKSQALG